MWGFLLGWETLWQPTTVLVLSTAVLGLLTWVVRNSARGYKQRDSARLKHFEKQLSKIKLGGPADRLEHILGEEALWKEVDLQASAFREKGHFRFYDLEYAFLKFAVREGRIEAFSVRTKTGDLRYSILGNGQCRGLALGDSFGLCPDNQVFYREISAGAHEDMNWYLECRPNVGEVDPNIWLNGWRPEGYSSNTDPWWKNRPACLESWPRKFRARHELSNLTVEQREELTCFRNSLGVNVVGTMTQAEYQACDGSLTPYA